MPTRSPWPNPMKDAESSDADVLQVRQERGKAAVMRQVRQERGKAAVMRLALQSVGQFETDVLSPTLFM